MIGRRGNPNGAARARLRLLSSVPICPRGKARRSMTDLAASEPAAARRDAAEPRPLHVCHVLLRLGCGGMENGLITIANGLRGEGMRHSVVCLDTASTFRDRLAPDVPVHTLAGRYRGDMGKYRALWRVLRELRPDIVHTRNLATIDLFPVVLAAGVRRMVHSEHGVDLLEADGSPLKYRLVRRLGARVIPAYVALSRGLRDWMAGENGIPRRKIRVIVNGVDTARFRPPADAAAKSRARAALRVPDDGATVIGSLGRLEAIKDHANLARAFVALARQRPDLAARAVLLVGGEGSCRGEVRGILDEAGLGDRLVMAGYVADTPGFYRALDVFVLPSKSEGTSNTVLEAMASGLPVVATDVGENARLVAAGETGAVVPARDPGALAAALVAYLDAPERARRHGAAGRARVCGEFSLDAMLEAYAEVYRGVAGARGRALHGVRPGASTASGVPQNAP